MRIDIGNNIKMTRGDSEAITVSCEQQPFVEGDKITITVRKSKKDTTKVMQKDVTEFVEGKALISIEPSDTSSLAFGDYIYDIQITRADGTVKTIIKPATFTVELEVSYDDE